MCIILLSDNAYIYMLSLLRLILSCRMPWVKGQGHDPHSSQVKVISVLFETHLLTLSNTLHSNSGKKMCCDFDQVSMSKVITDVFKAVLEYNFFPLTFLQLYHKKSCKALKKSAFTLNQVCQGSRSKHTYLLSSLSETVFPGPCFLYTSAMTLILHLLPFSKCIHPFCTNESSLSKIR